MFIKSSKLLICLLLLSFSFVLIRPARAAFLEWDHTALKNINMNNFWISGNGINDGIFINSGNGIGIGLTNPRQKLDVAGYIRGGNGLCIKNDCRTSWPSDASSIETFWTQSSLGIYTFNNVAINRNNPLYALHVNGAGAFSGTVEVATPVSDFHATTKKYVDDAISKISIGTPGGNGEASHWSLLNNHIYNNNAGNVGIGINNPKAKLNILGGVLAEEIISNEKAIFFWNPVSGSFRAGRGNSGDASGNNSIALGFNANASGPGSIAIGQGTKSSGYFSVAIGQGTEAQTAGDFAFGSGTKAYGGQSFAMGAASVASGWGAVAFGVTSSAHGSYSLAAGRSAFATGEASYALGHEVSVSGQYSTIIGEDISNSINRSLLIGWKKSPSLFVSTAGTGINTTNITTGIALEVNGKARASEFVTASDKNLKTNIKKLDGSLGKLMQLQGVSFDWRSNDQKQLGLIAQDVEKVFPEAVFGLEGEKGISYSALIAPLIEAVKEQQIMINQQQQMINNLNEKINLLTK